MRHPESAARGTALLTLGLSAFQVASAQELTPNQAAPDSSKPFVEVANGQPVVLIAEPNAAGVSRNEWDKFNVKDVLVLNNATGTVNTVTAGKVGANPFLLIPAKVILNEVTGTSSSDLRGVIEVAGGRADVVVANPYGVSCNGCGFVNAGRVTLTTGKGEFDASGAIKSFTPAGGKIVIGEAGLNASDSEYFTIISRAVEIGGPLYGNKVDVVAGKGTVDYATLAQQTVSQGGPVPEFAIDVGALGSIHAGQIYLVSNEKGAGVRSEGQLYAQDSIRLSADGTVRVGGQAGAQTVEASGQQVEVSGQAYGAERAQVEAKGAASVTGTLAAGNGVKLSGSQVTTGADAHVGAQTVEVSGAEVRNAGTLNGAQVSVQAANLANQGQVSAVKADLKATGDLTNTGKVEAQDLSLQAGGKLDNAGTVAAQVARADAAQVSNAGTLVGERVQVQANSVDNSGALGGQQLAVQADRVTNQGQVAAQELTVSAGKFKNAGTVAAETASVEATEVENSGTLSGDQVRVGAQTVDNTGDLAGRELKVKASRFTNAGGVTAQSAEIEASEDATNSGTVAAQSLSLKANRVTNTGALAGETVRVRAGVVENQGAVAAAQAELEADEKVVNSGTVTGEAVRITAPELNNAGGQVVARRADVTAGAVDNRGGMLASEEGRVQARTLRNAGGTLNTDELDVRGDVLDNTGGLIGASRGTVQTAEVLNAGGVLAGEAVNVQAGHLNNAGGTLLTRTGEVSAQSVNNVEGSLSAGAFSVRGAVLDNTRGLISADRAGVDSQTLRNEGGVFAVRSGSLSAKRLDNRSGTLAGDALDLSADEASNQGGVISTGGTFGVRALDNTSGLLQARAVTLRGGPLTNVGGVVQTGALQGEADRVDNSGGVLAAESALLGTRALTNRGGLVTGGEWRVEGDVENAGGVITVHSFGVRGSSLNNVGGSLLADQASFEVAALDNSAGTLDAGTLSARIGTLNNAGGAFVWRSGQAQVGELSSNRGGALVGDQASFEGERLDNAGGLVQVAGLRAQVSSLNNAGGLISAQEAEVTAGHLDNTEGKLFGARFRLSSDLLNNAGGMIAGDAVSAQAGTLNNAGGLISAQQLQLGARTLNNGGGELVGDDVKVSAETFDNAGGKLFGTRFTVSAQSLNNQGGLIGGQGGQVQAAALNNAGGELYAEALRIEAGTLLNTGGQIAGTQVDLQAGEMDNAGGGVLADRLGLNVAGTLNNQGGRVEGNFTTVDVGRLTGSGGVLTGADTLRVKIRSDYTHQDQNVFTGGRELGLDVGGTLRNEGTLRTGGVLNVTASGDVTNVATLVGGQLNVTGANVYNTGPRAVMAGAGGGFHVKTPGRLENTGGATLYGLGNSSFSGATLYNHGSNIRVLGNFDVEGQVVNTRDYALEGQESSRQVTRDIRSETGQAGQRTLTETTQETVATRVGPAGRIVVSGDLNVNGQLRNEASAIYAGGDLRVNGRSYQGEERPDVVNIAPENVRRVQELGLDTIGGASSGYLKETTERTAVLGPDGRPLSAVIAAGGTLYVAGNAVQNGNTAPTNLQRGALPPLAGAAGGDSAPQSKPDDGAKPEQAPKTDDLARTLPTTPLKVTANAMYTVEPTGSGPVVTTNPELLPGGDFQFVSSRDVYGSALGRTAGDGFYEQELMMDQMLLLRPQDPRLADSNGLYAELLAGGKAAQERLGLTPGVPLTPEQMAQLDRDVVLMEPQTVQTEQGPVTALAPRVYLARGGQAALSGSVLTGHRVQLQLSGDLSNDSRIYAGSAAQISASDIHNRLGEIGAGQTVSLRAERDVVNRGGSVRAGRVEVQAGRDILAETLTRQYSVDPGNANRAGTGPGASRLTNTELQAAGFYGEDVRLQAGQDITFAGAQVVATRSADLTAGRDVNLAAVRQVQENSTRNADGSRENVRTNIGMGSVIASDQIRIDAGRDLRGEGAQLTGVADAQGNGQAASLVSLRAGRNQQLFEVRHTQTTEQQGSVTQYGFLGLNKKTTDYHVTTDLDLAQGTTINARTVVAHAGGDLTTRGLQVRGAQTGQVSLSAGGKLTLGSAENFSKVTQDITATRSGLSANFDKGFGVRLGYDRLQATTTTESVGHLKTEIEADDVSLMGGQGIVRAGSSIKVKGQGTALIGSDGQPIEERAVHDRTSTQSTVTTSNTGLTLGVKSDLLSQANEVVGTILRLNGRSLPSSREGAKPAEVVPSGFSLRPDLFAALSPEEWQAQQQAQQAAGAPAAPGAASDPSAQAGQKGASQGPRTNELRFALTTHALRGGYDLYNMSRAASAKGNGEGGSNPYGVKVGVWLDHSGDTQTTTQTASQAVGNTTEAKGGTVIYRTVGDPRDARLLFEGSKVEGRKVVLRASGTIDARSAVSEAESFTSAQGYSVGLGVSGQLGMGKAGVGVDASLGAHDNGVGTWQRTHQNTLISGQEVSVQADTVNLHGATLFADDLDLQARRLSVVSQQDQAGISGSGWSFGINAFIPVVGVPSGNISGSIQDQAGEFRAVGTPSGIQAGRARIAVEEGELVGGFITTTGDPAQSSITGHFVQSDLKNSSTYRNRSFGGSIGTDLLPRLNLGLGAPQKEEGVTRGEITQASGGTLDRAAVLAAYDEGRPYAAPGQPSLADFNALPAVMAEKQEAAAMFSQDAYRTVGDLSLAMGWQEGSLPKVALHAAVGAATARLGGGDAALGAVVGGTNELAIPTFDKLAQRAGLSQGAAGYNAALQLGSVALGSALGSAIGADALSSGGLAGTATGTNYLTHANVAQFKREVIACKGNTSCIDEAASKYERLTLKQINGFVFEGCKGSQAEVKKCVEEHLRDAYRAKNDINSISSFFFAGLDPKTQSRLMHRFQNGPIWASQYTNMFRDPLGNGNSDFNGMVRTCLSQGAYDWDSCLKISNREALFSAASGIIPGGVGRAASRLAGSSRPVASSARPSSLTPAEKALVGRAAKLGPWDERQIVANAQREGVSVTKYVTRCFGINSFDPFTSVWTLGGLQPIGSLKVGTLVLAFNEATGQNGYYPITAVHRNLDPKLTFLWVKTNGTGAKELIETTPEHPFYLAGNVDGSGRPAPQGHEELSERWVGAGHLKAGDRLKLADGSLGTVLNVTTVQQTREMFNLTVAEAHTFYVGRQGWLVHNCGPMVMNGATLDHLTPAQIAQIQRYADASGATVKLFGSRASGVSHLRGVPVGPDSDFDYLIEGANSKWMKRALTSEYRLPKGGGGGQIERGFESGIDLWRPEDFTRRNWTLNDRPHIIFTPKAK